MCMHIPRARHHFPPLCPVLLSVLGIGWWVTLAPCVHHHIWGGGRHWDSTQASESCLLAHTHCRYWDSEYITMMASVTGIFVTRCHVTVTRACPVITSSHHPPRVRGHVITPIRLFQIFGFAGCINIDIKWRCSLGNYSSELIRCAILLNVTLPVLWNDVTPQTCQTLQSVQCPKHSSALLISFISMWAHLIAVNICVNSTDL